MKISIKELMGSQQSLMIIGSLRLNSALKFRLARVIKQVNAVITDAGETREELIKREGGVLSEDGAQYVFFDADKKPDKAAAERVNSEYKELLKEEVEIRFDRFSEDTFEKLEISANDIANCYWLFGGFEDEGESLVDEVKSNGAMSEAAPAN